MLYKMYVTLKLDGNGCRIHSVSDGDGEIVTDETYVVMPWKMVSRGGANMRLVNVVKEIKKREEERRLVSKFENEHRDEINEIFGLIKFVDESYVRERYLEIYNFGLERLGINLDDGLVLREHKTGYSCKRKYSHLDYFKGVIKT